MDSLDISFYIELARQENGMRKGYQYPKGLWFPHESVEGGLPTIAYGHKLTQGEYDNNNFGEGIDDFDAVALLVDDFSKAWKLVEKQWDAHFPDTPFISLPRRYQYILAELVFNAGPLSKGGTWRWPKLASNIRSNNDQGVYEQSIRYFYNKNNVKTSLESRSRAICRALGLYFNPINL